MSKANGRNGSIPIQHVPTDMPAVTRRFEVVIQHTVIVYAEDEQAARARAPNAYMSLFVQPAASRPIQVMTVHELPLTEKIPVIEAAHASLKRG